MGSYVMGQESMETKEKGPLNMARVKSVVRDVCLQNPLRIARDLSYRRNANTANNFLLLDKTETWQRKEKCCFVFFWHSGTAYSKH